MGVQLKSLSREEQITAFKEVHGDSYDYSKYEFNGSRTKATFICKIHGEFQQQPYSHLRGHGCTLCGFRKTWRGRERSRAEIIESFIRTHGDRYDYSKVEAGLNKTKVTIICRIHGEFQQSINNHQQGQDCPKCTGTPKKTLKEVLTEFRQVHGDKYDYSQIEYVNSQTPMKILCPAHGPFFQSRLNHGKQGKTGCPVCAWEFKGFRSLANLREGQRNYQSGVYLLKMAFKESQWIKVGIAKDVVDRITRIKQEVLEVGFRIELYAYRQLPLYEALLLEKQILDSLHSAKITPPIKFSGSKECLSFEALKDAETLFFDEQRKLIDEI
ncbi:DUF723 domain-containing protein [Photobacterium sp. GSS17]|uniref:DUF723 domain-containing protein n=1 Tax=Photobacterium sp. GSS17 TaxID=3020715 RepID=UPI002360FF32|nr:DUF723 domain-containing protein [Photobacterium sp. GSS17]